MEKDAWTSASSALETGTAEGTWGLSLPSVTMTQMAYYCAATGVRDPIHYDRDFARQLGFRDAVANGSLRLGWMCYAGEALASPGLRLVSVRCQHRGPLYVGDDISMEIAVRPAAGGAAGPGTRTATITVATAQQGVCDVGEIVLEAAGRPPAAEEES
jgi:acyl dehydratase